MATAFLTGMAATAGAHGACVDPTNPLASPVAGVEMFYDIHLPQREIPRQHDEPFATSRDVAWTPVPAPVVSVDYGLPTRPGVSSHGLDASTWGAKEARDPVDEMAVVGHTTRGQGLGVIDARSDGRPPFVWPDHIDPVGADRKALGEVGGAVYFYEPAPEGGRRLCRMESWGSRTRIFDVSSRRVVQRSDPIQVPASPNQTRNPALAALSRDYVMIGYSNLVRDDRGRLPHLGPTCFHYTDDGQVRRVDFEAADGTCSDRSGDPKREASIEVLFDAQGKGHGAVLNRPVTWVSIKDSDAATRWRASADEGFTDGWRQEWHVGTNGGTVTASAYDRTGVFDLYATGTTGEKDDTVYNTPTGEPSRFQMTSNQSDRRYVFPAFMSTDVLRKPDTLYRYERVRLTGGSVELAERFAAGGNQLLARIWTVSATGNVPRQEIFENGKLVRAIVTDFTTQEDHGKLWIEDLVRYKDQIKVPFEHVYLRVYDYDTDGKERLVAIGWTDYPRPKFFAHHRNDRRQQLAKMNRLLGRSTETAEKVPAELTYFYGTPDGQVKWADWDAFNAEIRQQTPVGRKAVFPNGRNDDDIVR